MVKRKLNLKPFEDYLLGENCSNETIKSYTRTIEQFLTIIDKSFMEDITEKDLEKYKIIVNAKYNKNSLTPKYCAINNYLKFIGKSYEWISQHRLSPPKMRRPNRIPLTREETLNLFKASEDNPRDNAIIKVFYFGILRRSDVINLNVEDVDFDRQKLRLNSRKNGKNDEINLHPDALQAIQNYLPFREPKDPNEKALFLSREGNRISRNDIQNTIKRYASKVGLTKRVYPHIFRISGITHMAKRGLSIEEIKRQSGHDDIETLLGYIQLSDEEVRDAYLKGISFNEPVVEETKRESLKPVKQTTQQPQTQTEDKFYQLLRDGLITPEQYKELVSKNNISGYS